MMKKWNSFATFDTLEKAQEYIKNNENKSFIYSIEITRLLIIKETWCVEIHYKAICEGGDR